MKKFGFGEKELAILKIVSEAKRATVAEVYQKLGSTGSYTTIMTIMSRMKEKGDLKREKIGRQYVYWSPPKKHPDSNSTLKRLKDKIFGGKSASFVSYLLETDREITLEDLEEIEKLIKKKKSSHG